MMRRFFKPLFVILAIPLFSLLAGCGFAPLHSATGENAPLADIFIDLNKGSNVVDNQAGFFLTQRLRDRIGNSSESSRFTLKVTPNYRRSRLGLTVGDVASRYDVTVTAIWELQDTRSGRTIKRGRNTSVVTFGAPEGPFGVITADTVGVEESARETADKVIIDLAKHFSIRNAKSKT